MGNLINSNIVSGNGQAMYNDCGCHQKRIVPVYHLPMEMPDKAGIKELYRIQWHPTKSNDDEPEYEHIYIGDDCQCNIDKTCECSKEDNVEETNAENVADETTTENVAGETSANINPYELINNFSMAFQIFLNGLIQILGLNPENFKTT